MLYIFLKRIYFYESQRPTAKHFAGQPRITNSVNSVSIPASSVPNIEFDDPIYLNRLANIAPPLPIPAIRYRVVTLNNGDI